MSKDKKRDKDEATDLASLEGMVRVQAILRKYGVSPHVADLATEALDKMVSEAVSEIADRLEKAVNRAGLFISILLTIIAIFVGIQSLGSRHPRHSALDVSSCRFPPRFSRPIAYQDAINCDLPHERRGGKA